MSNFWQKNKDNLSEDVTADRPIVSFEPIHATKRIRQAKSIEIDQIEADPQHREHFEEDALNRLAKSLRDEGQLQPIRVRFDESRGKYLIIAGERRWRAAQIAKLETVDCIVAEGALSEADILRHQIIENALREDLKPTEQGRAYQAAMEAEGLNGKQLAEKLNVHPSTISRTIGLLSLTDDVQKKVDAGDLAMTQALKLKKAETTKSAASNSKATKKRSTKETKIKTSVGITVSFKARKNLKADEMKTALNEVLKGLSDVA